MVIPDSRIQTVMEKRHKSGGDKWGKECDKKSSVKRTIIKFYSLFDLMATINFPIMGK
jgi:hypothetical protein